MQCLCLTVVTVFSLAQIIFSLPNFTCHLTYFTPILILGICLYVKADLHFFKLQTRLCSCTYIYLLIIHKQNPNRLPDCGFFSRPSSFLVARGDGATIKFEPWKCPIYRIKCLTILLPDDNCNKIQYIYFTFHLLLPFFFFLNYCYY